MESLKRVRGQPSRSGSLFDHLDRGPGRRRLPPEDYWDTELQHASEPKRQHVASDQQTSSYWTATTSGQVNGFSANNGFGQANLYGDMANLRLNAPIVGMAALPGSQGHWLLGADGGVFSFGLARFYGSTGGMRLNAPVVGIAVTPDGGGYWLVAKDGGVFGYGDAGFYGSMGGCHSISRSSAWRSIKRRAAIGWLLPMEGSFRSTLRSMAAQGVLF